MQGHTQPGWPSTGGSFLVPMDGRQLRKCGFEAGAEGRESAAESLRGLGAQWCPPPASIPTTAGT